MQIQTALAKIVESKNLSREESAQVFKLIMTGETTDAQIGAFLAAMRVKGETAEELAGAAETMRSLSSKVTLTSSEKLVDTCGTGGSGLKLFNICLNSGRKSQFIEMMRSQSVISKKSLLTKS